MESLPGSQEASGISPGEVMYIGQENAKINAAIMLNIIRNLGIEKKNRILYYNQSQGQNSFAKALLSLCSGIPEVELQQGWNLTQESYRHLDGVVTDIKNAEVSVVGTPNISTETIIEDVCGLDKEKLPALILINDLRFLSAQKKCRSKQKLYRYIAEKLHQLARDMRIPIILTGPIAENRTGVCEWPLNIGDMPAAHMEEYFDKILMIYPERIREGKRTLDVGVIKNPDGWHGCYQMAYLSDCNEIREVEL